MSVEVRSLARVVSPSPAVNTGVSTVMDVEAAVPAVTTVGSVMEIGFSNLSVSHFSR